MSEKIEMFCVQGIKLKLLSADQLIKDRRHKCALQVNRVAYNVFKECLQLIESDKNLMEAWERHSDFDKRENYDIGEATRVAFEAGMMSNFVSIEDLMDWYTFTYQEGKGQ